MLISRLIKCWQMQLYLYVTNFFPIRTFLWQGKQFKPPQGGYCSHSSLTSWFDFLKIIESETESKLISNRDYTRYLSLCRHIYVLNYNLQKCNCYTMLCCATLYKMCKLTMNYEFIREGTVLRSILTSNFWATLSLYKNI